MANMTRTFRVRSLFQESQEDFGLRLGVSQGTIWRLEAGQPESGPQRMLLDQIERDLDAGLIGPASTVSSSTAVSPGPDTGLPAAPSDPVAGSDGAAFSSVLEPTS
jgi:transcriptional regulator with XRE-family HTH domain